SPHQLKVRRGGLAAVAVRVGNAARGIRVAAGAVRGGNAVLRAAEALGVDGAGVGRRSGQGDRRENAYHVRGSRKNTPQFLLFGSGGSAKTRPAGEFRP